MGICDSNEAEILVSLEALQCFSRTLNGSLVVDSDSSNAIAYVSSQKVHP